METARIVPANRVSADQLDLVMRDGGDAHRCRCQWFKLERQQWRATSAQDRADALVEQARCGRTDADGTSGLVAFVEDEPAGWVAVEPRVAYPALRAARVPWSGRDEDKGDDSVWAITCFVVRPSFRGRGIARELAVAAVEHARAHGAHAVEGYPISGDADLSSKYVGTPEIFAAAGMVEVSQPTVRRSVMRVDLT